MKKNIAVINGDGIGPEVTAQAIRVLNAVADRYHHEFTYHYCLMGACAIDQKGTPLPDETIETCLNSDAILFGAIGDPKYDNNPTAKIRPEQGLLKLRKSLQLFSNIRPIVAYPSVQHLSPLKESQLEGVDFIIFRELTGGIYFGKKETSEDGKQAIDECVYNASEIERIAHIAFQNARLRRKKLTLLDKSNVLETSRLWRKVVQEISKEYKDVAVNYMYVDNAAMQLVKAPKAFDVVVTGNLFGDILSDEAAMLTGSIGMLPSASLDVNNKGLYEPSHGSAPDIAGKGIANPLATILSAAMMLRYSLGKEEQAQRIENAVQKVLSQGYRTADIYTPGTQKVGTVEMGKAVLSALA